MREKILIGVFTLLFQQLFAQDAMPTLVFPATHLPVGNHVFDVMVKNVGNLPVAWKGINIGWQVDNGIINDVAPVIPTYPIASNSEERVAGNFTAAFTTTGIHTLKVWTRLTVGADANKANDTIVQLVKVLPYVPKKKVVFEVFKHQACCPCIDAAAYEDTAISPFANYSVANIYALSTDVLFNAEGDSVDNLFQLAHPTVFFDRFKFPYTADLANNFFTLNNIYDLRNMRERDRYYEPLEVFFVSASFNTSTRLLKVKLKAKVYDTISDNYRFNLYVTEDSVKGYQGCFTPPNDYTHMHVLRRMMGGSWGYANSLPPILYPGNDYYHEFTYTVPSDYELDHISLTGMVQRFGSNKLDSRIINSDHVTFNNALLLSVDNPGALINDVKVYPNPTTNLLYLSGNQKGKANISIAVYDANGKIVKRFLSKDINTILDMADVSFGHYIIYIQQGTFMQSFKVVKQ